MSSYTYLDFTVRRKDGQQITAQDLDIFANYLDETVKNSTYMCTKAYIATNRKEMYASCVWLGFYDESDFKSYAKAHPEMQIELIEERDDSDEKNRCLYEGDVMEVIPEVRLFPDPEKIDWKYGS